MKKASVVLLLCVTMMMVFASVVSAHVVVFPKEVTQGSYEKFTVRVPNEQETNTIKVEVKFPAGVTISRVEAKPGWTYEFKKEKDLNTSVIWTAAEGGIGTTEFAEFNMQGKVADDAAELSWKAYQTYKDGTVVEWIGAPDADKPASVTKVKAKVAEGMSDSHGGAAEATTEASTSSNTPLMISIAALAISLAALLRSFRRKV